MNSIWASSTFLVDNRKNVRRVGKSVDFEEGLCLSSTLGHENQETYPFDLTTINQRRGFHPDYVSRPKYSHYRPYGSLG